MDLAARLAHWRQSRNCVAIGNLGEQVTARLLILLDYQLLGAQDDFVGMVSDVLGMSTRANPEDFVAVDSDGRFMTVNSKASVSSRVCRITESGSLSLPRLARGQSGRQYSAMRANLASPVNGDSFAQVVKVDLVNMVAQVFEIEDDGILFAVGRPYDVEAIVKEVMAAFPDRMPPPNIWELT